MNFKYYKIKNGTLYNSKFARICDDYVELFYYKTGWAELKNGIYYYREIFRDDFIEITEKEFKYSVFIDAL